jgi:hypothetical protein
MRTSPICRFVAVVSALLLIESAAKAFGEETASAVAVSETAATPKIPDDELDSSVAPIALYPDPLLAQTLAASTYPIEVMQLQQWLDKNKDLKDQALADAVAKQP